MARNMAKSEAKKTGVGRAYVSAQKDLTIRWVCICKRITDYINAGLYNWTLFN